MRILRLLTLFLRKLLEYIQDFSLLLLLHYSKLPLRFLHFHRGYFIVLIVFYAVIQHLGDIMTVHAQNCSAKPILLKAEPHAQPVFFHTEGYENGRYANNMRCSWVLMGTNPKKRIVLTIHDSDIDDALFSQCDDYCSVHDGDTSESPEIVRWCGDSHSEAIISSTDSLYVYFHSDEAFQGRGISMSFVEFDVPGCPPNWVSSSAGYCYALRKSTRGLTWLEAQKQCVLERSNLLTLSSANEYSSVAAAYAKNKTLPWIGYTDFNSEGIFMSVDPNSRLWPEDIPKPTGSQAKDCVYMDWSNRGENVLVTDDCRNRHEYVCKRRQDGSTIPYPPQAEMMRIALQKPSLNFTVWLFVLLLLLLMLILLYLCYQKCQEQRATSRVGSSDANQRLVAGVDMQQATTSGAAPHLGGPAFQKTGVVTVNSGAKPMGATTNTDNEMHDHNSSRQATELGIPGQNLHAVRQLNLERIEPTVLTIEPRFDARLSDDERASAPSRSKQNPPNGREATMASSNTREETLLKIRRGELFERPHVSILDHTSAISLDEFWNKNEISTIGRT